MSAERELNIRITADASEAARALGQTGEGIKQTTVETGKGSQATKLFTGESREFHRTLGELTRAGLGPFAEALRGLAGGPTGIIFMAVGAFIELKRALDETNKSLAEQIEKNSDPTWLEGTNAKREAIEKLREEFEAYMARLEKVIFKEEEYNDVIDRGLDLLRERDRLNDKSDSAESGAAKAHIDLQVKTGQLSPAQAIVAKEQLDEQERQRQAARAETERHQIIGGKQDELAHAQGSVSAADAKVDAAEKEAERVKGEKEKNLKDAEALEKKQKELDDAAKVAAETAAGAHTRLTNFFSQEELNERVSAKDPFTMGLLAKQTDADDAAKAAQENFDAAKKFRASGEAPDHTAADLSNAEKEREELKASIEKLTKEIETLRDKSLLQDRAAVKDLGNENHAGRDTAATKLLSLPDDQTVEHASMVAQALEAHKPVAAADRAFLESFQQLLTQFGQGRAATIQAIAAARQSEQALQNEIQALQNAVQNIGRQSAQNTSRVQNATVPSN